ncbi:PREDICTED: T-cell receptor-associated transmembrane adapter 1-like [Chrysochloris asiatica]|uniref:T-cell receptor-associated transmembrane adapter 1-like n=1 Tax=Chrysochloris asiatica TaxID=185453 RepID=UPI0003F1468A|nr:PREDICTED: T-cell receptor-associated transmembrane adapter 1-like [Chrysochloris asiatica]
MELEEFKAYCSGKGGVGESEAGRKEGQGVGGICGSSRLDGKCAPADVLEAGPARPEPVSCILKLDDSENLGCNFFVWGLIAFLGLCLIISLMFNISHYLEKHRQVKLCMYSNDCIPRDDEYYIEETPIYGNLDNVGPEPTNENCYEQMKSRPEKSVTKPQELPTSQEATTEPQMCYASLNHSYRGKARKPRKQETSLSNTGEEEQLYALDLDVSKITSVDNLPPESQAAEENIHDDPIRLFGLIRAKNDPIN